MHCNENEKWEKFRPFPLFDGPKKDLGIWFPDIHSKSAGCIEKGVFFRYFILDYVCKIQGFHQVWYQGGVKATVSGVVEDLKFKISEGSDQNWCFPDGAQLAVSAKLRQLPGQSQENTNFGPNFLKF